VISVVIPLYNEEAVIPILMERLRTVLAGLGEPYEIITIDDGSSDRTTDLVQEYGRTWPELRLLKLARNVGHQLALTAGLDAANGDWIVTMDGDLQDPPELIPEMLRTAREDKVDIVYAARNDRATDTGFKRRTADMYYRATRRLTGIQLVPHVGDYRLLSRRVLEVLRSMPERHRVYRVMIPWLGFTSGIVEHKRDERAAGEGKYSLTKMALLATDSVVSFSTAPLRFATTLGLVSALLCVIAGCIALIAQLTGSTVPGWASIAVAVMFLGAAQLICLGLLGEYVGRIFQEVQRRPLYVVEADTSARDEATAAPASAAADRTLS
jgi:dolichol-phosphate mannosyltransferase